MVFGSLKRFSIYNLTSYDISGYSKVIKKVLKRALKEEKVGKCYFNVIIVDNDYIKRINKEYRNIDKETDVISFALEDEKKENIDSIRMLGDIYISIDKVKSQAKEYNHSEIREIAFLAVHGLLHLLGYDHMNKSDEEIMFNKQELILNGEKITR